MSAYREDLAYIHDSGHAALARDGAARLIEELAAVDAPGGTVVDLGCGSGVVASALVDAGYDVLGVDVSEPMIALARKRAPGAEFRVGSFVSLDPPASVAVAAVGEVLNYGFHPHNDDRARAELFRRVYRSLVPGGVFLFDVAGPDRARSSPPMTHGTGVDWAVLAETSLEPPNVLVRTITSFRQVGTLYRRDCEIHRLVLLEPAAVLHSLHDAGFEAQAIPRYKDVELPTGLIAFLARKPAQAR